MSYVLLRGLSYPCLDHALLFLLNLIFDHIVVQPVDFLKSTGVVEIHVLVPVSFGFLFLSEDLVARNGRYFEFLVDERPSLTLGSLVFLVLSPNLDLLIVCYVVGFIIHSVHRLNYELECVERILVFREVPQQRFFCIIDLVEFQLLFLGDHLTVEEPVCVAHGVYYGGRHGFADVVGYVC